LKTYIGIDNGVTGSIGIISDQGINFILTPVKKELSYTKTKQFINRVDFPTLIKILSLFENKDVLVILERPMVNPGRFKATVSALRALEATMIAVEFFKFPIRFEDSKSWQKHLLPSGLKKEELKKGSVDIGCRLFPQHAEAIKKHGDADSLLIAEYARQKNY